MFYLIDKPVGMTSFDIIRKLRKKLNIKKMGHIGTLDPLASGMLLIATQQSTKLLSYINSDKKTYRFSVKIDGTTPSLDLEEDVILHDMSGYKERSDEELKLFLENQKTQIPPQFSAININGKRAYKLARKDKNFDLPERKIDVSNVEILQNSKEKITIRLTINSGGYIRSFAPIIGQFFGTKGGYISELRREKLYIGNIFLDKKLSQNIENFDGNKNIPEQFLFPEIEIISIKNKELFENIKNGRDFFIENIKPIDGKKYILTFGNYGSLIQFIDGKYKILKNDIISSSQKIHTN